MTNAAFGARGNRKSASHREYRLKLNLGLTMPVAGCCNSVIYSTVGSQGRCGAAVQQYLFLDDQSVSDAVFRCCTCSCTQSCTCFFCYQFSSGVCNVQNSTVLYLCTQCWLRQLNVITVFISLIFLHNIYYLLQCLYTNKTEL